MNLLKLSWKNIISRPLGAILSITLLSLSIALISLMLHVGRQSERVLNRNIEGVDMVLGAKGSPLQLILSAVFQIDVPTGNILMKEAGRLAKSPLVKNTIPLSYGDSYQGYRIIGTETEYLELYQAEFQAGKIFQEPFEVVIGATVAQQLSLNLGDTFHSQHGFDNEGESHEAKKFRIVGLLKPSGTVLDKLLITPQASVWQSHQHGEEEEEEHDGHDHEEEREITAMLVKFRSPLGMIQVPRYVNEKTNMQAAIPSYEVSRLLGLMEGGIRTLQWLAIFIMGISCFSIFIGLYNAMAERKYEMALLRNFGASRWQLVWLVLQEGLILVLLGFGVGILLSRFAFYMFSKLSYSTYQFHFKIDWFLKEELYLLMGVVFLGVIASILPAIQVFRLQISKILSED